MKKKSFLETLLSFIVRAIDVLSIVMFIIIFLVAMAQIVMRWVFHNPLTWSEELIRLMFVWICYLGWTMASRKSSHIRITAVVSKLSPTPQKILETFNNIVTILFSIFMVVFGIEMTRRSMNGKAVTMQFINFAMVYGICPASNILIAIYEGIKTVAIWKPEVKEVLK